jgi:acyl carrier protein
MNGQRLARADIENVVLEAIRVTNLSRESKHQLEATIDSVLYGPGSPLDSLGLVSLLIEVEEGLRDLGVEVTLSDERAMSQRHSPFRSVTSLVDYIVQLLQSESVA